MNNHNYQDSVQHFAALKVYYQAEQYNDSSPSSLLYFILRRVDSDILLTDLELSWLRENNLVDTIKCIENKSKHIDELVAEASRLFKKYLPSIYGRLTKESLSKPIHFILKKLEMRHLLTPREISYLNSNDYFLQLGAFAEFQALMVKYQVTQYPDSQPSSPLFAILKQLDVQEPLSIQEIEWLQSQLLPEIFAIFTQQEHSRNLQFTALKEKYHAGGYTDTSYLSRPLYEILQQLDANKPVSELQIDWLKQQGLLETVAIAEEQENVRNFEALKHKYKATAFQESSISSHLYKVLKKIDAGDSLSEPDFNFLNKRKLVSTLVSYVQTKIGREQLLTETEYNWLVQNRQDAELLKSQEIRHYLILRKLGAGKQLDDTEVACFIVEIEAKIKRKQVLTETEYNWLVQNRQGNEILGKNEIFRYLVSKKLEEGKRLDEIEAAWLYDEFKDEHCQRTDWLIRYHEIEALFYENEYTNTGNKWNLANASSHWRKAEKPKLALFVTDELNFAKIKEDKLKAALLTTRGGAFRDLEKLDQAENCAMQAIQYYPQSHHPYTLMGAICFERGQYGEGEKWFGEAIQRGASPRDQDAELKRIVRDTKDSKKLWELIKYLLDKDSERYSWARRYLIEMGGIYFKRGQYSEGEEWFDEAIQRGAYPRSQDAELKSIVRDTKDSKKHRELIDYLLSKDSKRYGWAKEYLHARRQ